MLSQYFGRGLRARSQEGVSEASPCQQNVKSGRFQTSRVDSHTLQGEGDKLENLVLAPDTDIQDSIVLIWDEM